MKTLLSHVSPLTMLVGLSLLLLILCLPRQTSSVQPRDKRCYNGYKRHKVDNSPCPDYKLCKCSDTVLDCSFALKTMSDPKIPFLGRASRFQVLNFSNNGLTNLSDAHTFLRVSKNVRVLDLYNNNMLAVAPDLFKMLVKLNRLQIGGNNLDYQQLSAVLKAPGLRNLELKCGGLGDIPDDFFTNRSSSQLILMDLSWNHMKKLDMRVFRTQQRLEELFVTNNELLDLTTDYSPNLRVLDLHKNRLSEFPQTCSEDGTSLFPNLTRLVLLFNGIQSIPDRVCLPSLIKLNLNFNKIEFFVTNMFGIQNFPSLRSLMLFEQGIKIRHIQKYAFNNNHLQNLDFGKLGVDFADPDYVDAEAFYGCPNVTRLLLFLNNMKAVTRERFHVLFKEFKKLERLLAGKTQLQLEDSTMFEIMPNLKRLDLYENVLEFIPLGCFDGLTKLENLTLNRNVLKDIPENTFSEETLKRVKRLDLSGNSFVCDCSIEPLQRMMRAHPAKFVTYRDSTYNCTNFTNKTVQDFVVPHWLTCYLISFGILLGIICVFFIIILLIARLAYYMRMQINDLRHYLHFLFLPAKRAPGQFEFDVYVAYADMDVGWVSKHLIPKVEQEWKRKLCIHNRDLGNATGRGESEFTDLAVEKSRSVLFLFSKRYADKYEVDLRQINAEFVTTKKLRVAVILPTLTDDVVQENRTLRPLLRTIVSLKWREEWGQADENKFWEGLRDALFHEEKQLPKKGGNILRRLQQAICKKGTALFKKQN